MIVENFVTTNIQLNSKRIFSKPYCTAKVNMYFKFALSAQFVDIMPILTTR
jgi:hypothetical protein